jgi:hypothetical protein
MYLSNDYHRVKARLKTVNVTLKPFNAFILLATFDP